ncbi:prolipoprotein diacylglyceryl transferase [methane-oxidizing endosymbiont of Gigantopelta aegis]|uniref:prolipoprotein diacylglyceryl transferase n=1 Tax=methane-oxidizing endosymbiont of Gigantopelta aegis TaxID=2794938 RepID=UPI0018DD8A9B|nr:prolipoprotein diacylglyceryl transferase [methane-oxidizing endosymbiont of Gigantopelta aegis]
MNEYLVWNIDPVLLDLGAVKIRWYGLMFASAFMASFYVMQWIYRREGKNVEQLDDLLWYMAIGTIVGARLGHCLFYDPVFYLTHPLKIFAIWEGGLASHGASIGIILSLYLYVRKTGDNFLWLLDRVAMTSMIAASFIRVGNFFNSEIVGIPAQIPWAIIFPRVDTLPRHPVQLYESISYAVIFLVLVWVYRKTAEKQINGLLFGLFCILAFSARFVLEFFKTRQASYNHDFWLTTGQILSIPFFLIGVGVVVWALKRYRRQLLQ